MVDLLDKIYTKIYNSIISEQQYKKNKKAYILGGQPGCGKSSFITNNQAQSDIQSAIPINGDDYRAFHPSYEQIASTDIVNMPNRTQPFVNSVVETMIDILSDENYNLIIEGTLRTAKVPQTTCAKLKEKGYDTSLIVVACNVETSWLSTLSRAENMAKNGIYPRFVPIENYNNTISSIANNLDYLHSIDCFDHIVIADRNGQILYDETASCKPSKILNPLLDVENWHHKYSHYAANFSLEQDRIVEIYNNKTIQESGFQITNDRHKSISKQMASTSAYQQTLAAFKDLDLDNDNGLGTDYDYDFK